MSAAPQISGTLHLFLAFDWGEQILLERAAQLVPASRHELSRRRRTPQSFAFRPPPLHLPLEPVTLELAELGSIQVPAGLTLFDFAAVSLAVTVPFNLAPEALLRLASSLADPTLLVQNTRSWLQSYYDRLLPAIIEPAWQDDLSEEYFVFQLAPGSADLGSDAAWVAGLVHLENAPLSPEEINEALRSRLSYSPEDVFIPDWAAAVLVDRDCEETLQVIEFANLQLLEFRHIDNRLDERLAAAARTLGPLTRSALPFWRSHARPLRVLGELRVDANYVFERTSNALKLVGDPYLARVYRLLDARFHMDTWEENIRRKLDVVEGVFQIVGDQESRFRTEFLELAIVLLIVLEIILAFVR